MSEELTDEQIDIFVKNEKERLDTIFKAEALGVTISEKALNISVSIIKQLREEIKMLRKAVDTGIEVEDDLQAKIKRLEGRGIEDMKARIAELEGVLDYDKRELHNKITETLALSQFGFWVEPKDASEITLAEVEARSERARDYYLGKTKNFNEMPSIDQTRFHALVDNQAHFIMTVITEALAQ